MTEPISVTALNQYIKGLLDRDRLLGSVLVRSEISNYKTYPSGHHYFTLKDAESSIRCVMFRRETASLRFRPENGMKVIVEGRVSIFPRDGAYQLYCSNMFLDGVGELTLAFEQLKNRLCREGFFDPAHKLPLPRYPKRIALVTSPAGAAIRDMIRILRARWPVAEVILIPVRVQGEEAAGEIASALDLVNAMGLSELIIAGRGGGSMEDLWAFNEEPVAQAIFRSHIPVVSAVGHEPDVTISDFVADLRASTPSNAAELAVPDEKDLRDTLSHMEARMEKALERDLQRKRDALLRIEQSSFLKSPLRSIQEKRMLLDVQNEQIRHSMEKLVGEDKQKLGALSASLDALSPFRVLARGYAIAQEENGAILTSVKQVRKEDTLKLQLQDGTLSCRIMGKEIRYGRKKADL